MEFTVRKLTPNVGAEISGLDLRRPLDPDTMAKVRKVWLDNVVVVFPEQALDDDQQIAFSRQVGELELINTSALRLPGRASELGAGELMRPMQVEGVGRFVFLQDPQGGVVAIIQRTRQP